MTQNIVEYLREESIKKLFSVDGFNRNWSTWQPVITSLTPNKTATQILNLGDNLSRIFKSTRSGGRTQSAVSGGGASWEALVCWYLNICSIDRRTVVIKHNKQLIPSPINDSITVNYMNFISNTESDLVAITFPDKPEYSMDKELINIIDANGQQVPIRRRSRYNYKEILDALCHRDFSDLEIHIIQCKTNWNDNAQIPMLWDMVYSANNFKNNITVGKNGYSIHDISKFTYSFVTVPTVNVSKIKPTSTCVMRVTHISGGNYWGLPTSSNIASSVKELLGRNLSSGNKNNHLSTLNNELSNINTSYSYFRL